MSHVATVDLEVKDLEALQEACNRLGLQLVRDQQSYDCWYTLTKPEKRAEFLRVTEQSENDLVPAGFAVSDLGKCEHAIRLPQSPDGYEIGLARRRDGRPGYVLLWDPYSDFLKCAIGENASKLRVEYATAVAKRTALASGYQVTEQRRTDGSVGLRFTR